MAHELGLFAAHGLRVELNREVGWATIRDKIVLRELEAAQAPAAMVLAISLGIGSFRVSCLTGLVLNLHGNAITLSNRLWEAGVRDAATLRELIRSKSNNKPMAFGVAFSCSSHNFLLRKWLAAAELDSARDMNFVVVPPPQMAANLKAGNLDGYCVGEPWNSLAVIQRAGWVAELSLAIAPRHPEKVLLVRSDFAESRADEHQRLIASLVEACAFCQLAENREQVAQTLAARKYLNVRKEAIQRSLCGPLTFRKERIEPAPDLHIFSGEGVNEPSLDKAVWALRSLLETGVLPISAQLNREDLASMFRKDLFLSATKMARPTHLAAVR
jgi:ABC-type nitrate/sulfonate/bicarbonate transport system substrate-binding protein